MNDVATATVAVPVAETLRGDVSSKRAIASFLDCNLAFYIGFGVALSVKHFATDSSVVMALVLFGTMFAYFCISELVFASTPVKWFNGLKVVNLNGNKCSTGQIVVRNLFRLIEIGMAGLLISGIVALCSRRGQRIGDMVAGTLVIRTDTP